MAGSPSTQHGDPSLQGDRLPGLTPILIALTLLICTASWMAIERTTSRDQVVQTDARLQMRLDINAATAPELTLLPAIGPRLAERIVDDRAERGRFVSLADLARVPGIGPVTIERIAPYVVVMPTDALAAAEP